MKRTRLFVCLALVSCLSLLALAPTFAADVPEWWVGSKDEYESLVKEAKEEGKVVWWSHPDPACHPYISTPFEEEYGIEVEHTEYRTAQIVQRVIVEGAAGLYTVDVANLSVHHVPRLEKKGLLQKLPYEEKVSTFRDVDGLVSPNNTAIISMTWPRSLAYNTDKVPEAELPETYEDLLDPKWERKISIDTDLKEYIILAQAWGMEKTKDYLERLGKLKPRFHRSNTVITQMVAAGETHLAPGVIRRIAVYEFRGKGAPVNWRPLKPVVPLDLALQGVMSHAPHPNAAQLFVYWMLGSGKWLNGLKECEGYGHALIPGNHLQKALKEVETVPFGWEWGVKAAKEGWGEGFRKIVGAE